MRILLTGMTNMQQNRIKKRTYDTSINALYHALRAAKHDVDWRRLEFNEKGLEKKYDLLLLGLGTMSEFSCTALYETLLATQCENVLYFVNDWKANATIKLLKNGDLFREFVLRNNTGKHVYREEIEGKWEKKLERCREKMFRFGDNLLGPFFPWGDRRIIVDGTPFTNCLEFNPTRFYLKQWNKKIELPKRKKKQWVYGALADYSKWHERLKPTWPVVAFNKKTFIPEELLIAQYAKSYGMLMPKYKASGSGWWRARYCHAMLCENVIYADQSELVGTRLWDALDYIEGLSPVRLRELAKSQAQKIQDVTASWDHEIDHIHEIVMEHVK